MAAPAPDAWAITPDMRAIFDALRALQPQGRRYRTTESTGQPIDRPKRARSSTGPLRTLLDELVVTYRRVAEKHGGSCRSR